MERLIPALGTALLHSLWQGALVALLCLPALRLARRPGTRHALACAALLLCLLLPLGTLAAAWHGSGQTPAETPAQVETAPAQAPPVVPGLRPYQVERLQTFMPHLRTWAMPRLVLLWACGAALMALRLGSGWALSLHWRRSGQPAPAPWQARLEALAHRMGLGREVRLQLWDRSAGPLTCGFWRPVVLVPAALLVHLDPDHLEALLAHELAHVRRLDYLLNLLQSLVLCLLFYHPAVWWLSARLRVERERAADALAAEALGDPRRLALALDALDDLQDAAPPPALALAARGGVLLDRIRLLLRPERRPVPTPWIIPTLLMAALLAASPLGAAPRRRVAAAPAPEPFPAPEPAPTPRPVRAQEPPPAGDILATGLLNVDPRGVFAWWSFVVPHGPRGFQVDVVENRTGSRLGRMGWGFSDSEQPEEAPLAFSRPRLTTSLPAFPSAVKIVVRDLGRGLQGETVLLEPLSAGMAAPGRPVPFQVVLNRPLTLEPAEPPPARGPSLLSGVVFMRSAEPWLLVSAHPTQETWTLSVYGDDPEKPLASGRWTPGKEAFPFTVNRLPKVLRLHLEDEEGRSHATVFQLRVDPDLLGSGRSAREDFTLRLD